MYNSKWEEHNHQKETIKVMPAKKKQASLGKTKNTTTYKKGGAVKKGKRKAYKRK